MFPPCLLINNKTAICQTVAILSYISKKFKYHSKDISEEDEAKIIQICCTVADLQTEACNAYHPIRVNDSYESQKEEAKPFIKNLKEVRLPRYLKFFQNYLGENDYFVNNVCSVADISVFQILRGVDNSWNGFLIDEFPVLSKFKERMENRENIKNYLNSEKCQKLEGNSLF
jgi:glutathione S-transferase